MFTQTRPLLHACIVCARSAVCHADVVKLSQCCKHAALITDGQLDAVRGS